MCYKGLIKRIVPFFLTFAAGLFIASFFVTIAAPSFNFRRGPGRYGEMQRLRSELNETKQENTELRMQIQELRERSIDAHPAFDFPFEPDAPAPLSPPKASRNLKFDR